MRVISVSARLPVLALVLIAMTALPARASAQDGVNHLYDKFQATATAADVILSSDIQINNSNGDEGTEINLDDIGVNQNAFAPMVGISWRPGKRHELQLGYLWISRKGSRTIAEDIDFADTTFTAGAQIESKFSAPTLALLYRFSIMAKEKTQLGLQVGLGAVFFGIDIDAIGQVTGGGADTTAVQYSASKSLTGPTAALGVFGNFRLSDRWYLGVNGGAIGATVSGITATTWLAGVNASYFFSNHWGAAAGWTINGIKVSSEPDNDGSFIDLSGSIKYTYQVIRVGVIYALH